MSERGWVCDRAKRSIDVVVASSLLVVTSPLQALVALVVRATLGPPVIFRQTRPGRAGVPFELAKFRTMHPLPLDAADPDDAGRLTRFGRVLRSTSLDELPTLWNVLRGDMSLVGPRPLLMDYLERYTPEQAKRHEVRPGITGLAQVSGRNSLGWEERLALDVEYVRTCSLALDARILGRTVAVVFGRHGTSAPDHATMAEFRGNTP